MSWYSGKLLPAFVYIGVLPTTAAERRLGGKDAASGYSGKWSEGMGWPVLWAAEHARAPEAFLAKLAKSD